MATDVVSTASLAGGLDLELEQARATLKGVEDNIKRVFGKDTTELGLLRYNTLRIIISHVTCHM
jgi:hypothetical protein